MEVWKKRKDSIEIVSTMQLKMTMAHEKWKSDMHSNANMTTHHISVQSNDPRKHHRRMATHFIHLLTWESTTFCGLGAVRRKNLTRVHTFWRTFRAYIQSWSSYTSVTLLSTLGWDIYEKHLWNQLSRHVAYKDPFDAHWVHHNHCTRPQQSTPVR